MSTQISHNGGLVDAVLELGFDQVKYFEGTVSGVANGFTINPPARRIQVTNKDASNDLYFRINGSPASTAVSFIPGDNIKLEPGCTFTMDYDTLDEVSFITPGSGIQIAGLLGWKGTISAS